METRDSIVGLEREVFLKAETRAEAIDEVGTVNTAIKQTIWSSGVESDTRITEEKGSIKVVYTNDNFRAQLTGILRQGVHGETGPKFSYRVTSEEYIPSLNAADNSTKRVSGCIVGCSALFFTVILSTILFFIVGATGFVVLSGWYVVIVGALSTFTGAILSAIPCWIIWHRAERKVQTDENVQVGLEKWTALAKAVFTGLDRLQQRTEN